MRRLLARIVVLTVSLVSAERARAIGWDSNDFIISGGPSFTTRIGVFDHDLTFKGFLDDDFVFNTGMDFDAAGNLVAVGGGNAREVRVYSPSGARVGGFASNMYFAVPGDIKVTPTGEYLVAMNITGPGIGARRFTPQGALLREYTSNSTRGAVVLPGNRLWLAGPGATAVNVFDLDTGSNLGSLPIAGLAGVYSMRYSATTDSVLIATVQSNAVIETDLSGVVLRTFVSPFATSFSAVTRGPDGHVFATATSNSRVLEWDSVGAYIGETSTLGSTGSAVAIVWAGDIPEPSATVFVAAIGYALLKRRH